MVQAQIAGRGVRNAQVLDAMSRIPRDRFVPAGERIKAYEDRPLPIGADQTISQPFMVGLMTALLRLTPQSRVLEIGTGSGYQTAVLASLAGRVISLERHPALAHRAAATLRNLGFDNVEIHPADGTCGWAAGAPYSAILVTAGAPALPEPLLAQLADGGRMVCPVGPRDLQHLMVTTRRGDTFAHETNTRCVFVPLIGQEGWPDDE